MSFTGPGATTMAGLSAAFLPPEAGGPSPTAVGQAAARLLAKMPPSTRRASLTAARSLDLAALLRYGERLRQLEPGQRAALLEGVGRLPAGASVRDSLKSLIMLGWGAEHYAEEIETVANSKPALGAAPLTVIPGAEWPDGVRADAIVIGSGAGGAFAARELSRAGLDTVVVEEGSHWDAERLRQSDEIERFGSLYRDGGATLALGTPSIALPMGRAIGGTTVINSGTCFQPPPGVRERWLAEGLSLAEPGELDERLAEVERTIGVATPADEVLGRNAELSLAGADALGWEAAALRRNAPGCRGACQCAIGCPNNAKSAVHLNALPQAQEAGTRIVSELRVERILVASGRAVGVLARREDGRRVELQAPKVIVACGTTETPPLLRRSGLGRHPRLGYGLSIHPAVGISAVFAEPVHAWRGVMQSVGVEELHERHGVMIEATSSPPGMGAVTAPGYGPELVERLGRAEHLAQIGALIADPPSGRVIGATRSTILYRLGRSSERRLRIALGGMALVMLAAGAERVELGAGSEPVTDRDSLERALEGIDVRRLRLAGFHPTGTVAGGGRAQRHPAGPQGQLRGVEGVWVADGSILPSCPGVNPQISIMALAAGVGRAAAA